MVAGRTVVHAGGATRSRAPLVDPSPDAGGDGSGIIRLPFDDATVMGPPSVPASSLAGWYFTRRAASWVYRATVSLDELTEAFVDEGRAEGVRGDIGFCQSCIETGWFSWPYPASHPSPITPEMHNYAGIGATDDVGNRRPARFPNVQTGVRAQMQHLRAYATTDGGCDLHQPCVDPRFHLVQRGAGVWWSQYGNGVWASSPNNYGGRILDLFREVLAWHDEHGRT